RHRDVPRIVHLSGPVPAGISPHRRLAPFPGVIQMNHSSRRQIRLHALAAATAVALSVFVAAPASAGQANLEGLQSDVAFDQFIVKYRDGAPEHADAELRSRGLDNAAASLVGISSSLQRQGVRTGTLRVAHARRLAVGAD